jgi:hypothetical protein
MWFNITCPRALCWGILPCHVKMLPVKWSNLSCLGWSPKVFLTLQTLINFPWIEQGKMIGSVIGYKGLITVHPSHKTNITYMQWAE